jgi:hypothetical protein
LLYEWNRLDEAAHCLDEACARAEAGGFHVADVLMTLARAHHARRDHEAMRAAIDAAARGSAAQGISATFVAQAELERARLNLAQGDVAAAARERGFGWLKNVAINPHLTEAKRENELVNVLDAHPELLGIGLDEKAALVVQGDRCEVIGEGRVAIYDDRRHGANWYYWLSPGVVFDLRSRSVLTSKQ